MASAPPAPAVRNNTGRAGDQQHAHRGDNPFGHIAFRLLGLFSGQWDALNCKEEPDRERHRGPDAEVSERQERRRARGVGGRDIGEIRGVEAADRRDREDQQTGQRDGQVHARNHHTGDQQTTETALCEAEVPP
jgi:hypothetical protein